MISTLSVFVVDRATFTHRADMINVIAFHLEGGGLVQVEDSSRPAEDCLCYDVQRIGDATHAFGVGGRRLGVFADVAAMVEHTENATANF